MLNCFSIFFTKGAEKNLLLTRMKKAIFILAIIITSTCYAQEKNSLLKQDSWGFQIWVATPIDSTRYKLEKYSVIKQAFLFYEDTLYKEPK